MLNDHSQGTGRLMLISRLPPSGESKIPYDRVGRERGSSISRGISLSACSLVLRGLKLPWNEFASPSRSSLSANRW